MANVSAAKRRVLREAIRSNLGGGTVRAPRAHVAPRRRARAPFWGALVVALVAYAIVPSRLASTPQTPAAPLRAAPARLAPVAAAMASPRPMRAAHLPAVPPRPLDRAAFPLSVKRVVIDPGHGGEQLGAVSPSGVAEKDITLDIGLRLRRLMQQASFDVLMTRDTDETLALGDRVAFANAHHADLFVSVHVNSIPSPRARPLETYYVGPTNDPSTIRLTRLENRDSGHTLADYRRLLDEVYMDARRDESRRLASSVNARLYRELSPVDPGLENRGVKTAPFVVLLGTEMPAILTEVSCVTNQGEVALLMDPAYRERIARALLHGIQAYANGLDGSNKRGL